MLSYMAACGAAMPPTVNSGIVDVNVAGTLLIDCNTFDDDSTAQWKITHTNTVLQIAVPTEDYEDIAILDGDWTFSAGRRDVDSIGFQTTGSLNWSGGVMDCLGGTIAEWGYTP